MRELQNSISSDGEVRRETHSGREYAIFPSIIAKEGVMDYPEFGRKEYLPAESLEQSADQWADVPITVNHPPDRGNGRTAQIPESYTSEVIGRLFNPEIVGDDRLRGEVWLDVEKSRDLGGIYEGVLNSLLEGEEVGVSTGYGAAEEVQNGVFDGESYDLIQTDIFPNHLSLLTPDKTPRMGPEDGVGAPRLNHVTMTETPDDTDESQNPALIERARAFGAAFRESFGFAPDGSEVTTNAESPDFRLNQQTGDAVRWDSDSGGEREPSGVRYGVVVDGLNASDEPDDSVLVAVYRANSDYDSWENAGEQQAIQTDTLEVVGNDGVDSLPAISQVFDRQNAVEDDGDDVESDSEGSEEAEADDQSEADAESTDSTDEASEDGDDADSDNTDNDLLESMSDNDNEFDRDETIESLDSDEDVPFDANVLEEMTDEQIRTISPDAADGEEPPDSVDDGRKEEGVDEEDADASAEDEDAEDDGEGEPEDDEGEENPDPDADAQTETTDSPETPGDDSTETKVEMTVNELEERLNSIEDELEETKKENEELREKVDPDVIKAKQAREQLAEATETDAEELAALPDETAINMASNLGDSQQVARANTMPNQQTQQRPNMAGAPGPVSRTNTEDEELPPAGREAYDQRRNGDS